MDEASSISADVAMFNDACFRLVALGHTAVVHGNLEEACAMFEAADDHSALCDLVTDALERGNLAVALRAAKAAGITIPPENLLLLGDNLVEQHARRVASDREAAERRQARITRASWMTLMGLSAVILVGVLTIGTIRVAMIVLGFLLVTVLVSILSCRMNGFQEHIAKQLRAAELGDLLANAREAYARAGARDRLVSLGDSHLRAGNREEARKAYAAVTKLPRPEQIPYE